MTWIKFVWIYVSYSVKRGVIILIFCESYRYDVGIETTAVWLS